MQGRAYALAFLIVILMGCGGAYLGVRAILDSVQAPVASPEWTPLPPLSTPEVFTPIAPPTASPTLHPTETRPNVTTPAIPTATPITPFPTLGASPQVTPGETATIITGTVTIPTATVVDESGFAILGQVINTPAGGDCPSDSVRGRVYDRQGNPLPGVRLWLLDEYGNESFAVSKGEQVDLGKYDIPIFGVPRKFYLVVLDSSGHPDSQRVEIIHKRPPYENFSCHFVDWQRRR